MIEPSRYPRRRIGRDAIMVAAGIALALIAAVLWSRRGVSEATEPPAATQRVSSDELKVPPDTLTAAGIQSASVTLRPAVDRIVTTGVVEANQERIQQVTPLVGGRVERVAVALGDPIQSGSVLVAISSPQIAELRGNLRAAEAKLAEADATLTRTKRLVELGAGAGKDLVAAEAEHATTQAQVAQLQQSLRAFGAEPAGESSVITIRAPASGRILERTVNPGAWIEAGKPLITIANLSTVWVIVNIPEARLNVVRVGAPVEIRAPALDSARIGRVGYIDPQLDQDTRTAHVRVEVPNPGEAMKIGMFVDITVEGPANSRPADLVIPIEAVQRIGERTVVFTPTEELGRFGIRDVELGDEIQNLRVVLHGLKPGDRVVTKGGFTLKSQLLKGQFADDDEPPKKDR